MLRPSSKSSKHPFDDYYDDSSDEESVQEKIDNYDINQAWESFKSKSEESTADNLLSFVAHAAGIKFLYSADVNELYYNSKSHLLKTDEKKPSASKQLEEILTRSIVSSLELTLIKMQEFLQQADPDLHKQNKKEKIYQAVIQECQIHLPALLKPYLPKFITYLKANHFTNKDNIHFPNEFKSDIIELLSTHFFTHITIPNTKSDREIIKKKIFVVASKRIVKIITQLNINNLMNKQGCLQACAELEKYTGKYPHLVRFILHILQSSPARGYIEKIITKNIVNSSNKEQIIFTFISDLLAITERDQAKQKLLDDYFSLNKTSLLDILNNYGNIYLHEKLLIALKSIERPVLGRFFEFSSRNPNEFYANLRLSNRSQKRQILNLQQADRQDTVARLWSMSDDNKVSVLETQTILKKSFGRKDIVADLSNYTKIYENIKQIQLQFPLLKLSDRKLALGIRHIFKNQPITFCDDAFIDTEIKIKLHAITYLLFGCEAARNPAMIVINQMLIDLIINKYDWNFQKAFVVEEKAINCMPMAPEGAVAIARSLEADYRPHMPYTYFYRGVIEDKKSNISKSDLVSLEATIVNDWLHCCKKITNLSKLTPARLLSYIESEFTNWLTNSTDCTNKHPKPY